MGIQITVHKCMGKTSYTVFGIDFNKNCKCKHNNQKHKSSCCNKKHVLVKTINDGLTAVTKTISPQKISVDSFVISASYLLQSPYYSTVNSTSFNHSPPDWGVPLNTLHCVSRI